MENIITLKKLRENMQAYAQKVKRGILLLFLKDLNLYLKFLLLRKDLGRK